MEECPTCRNPIGASLKQLRDERDRLIPFVTKNSELQRQYRQKLDELDHRQEAIEARENSLKNKEEDLLSSEVALEELLNEAKRPEEEFKKLANENQRIKNELANERINYKKQEAKRIGEIEILNKKNEEYRRSIGEQRDKIKSLSEDLRMSNSFRETYRYQVDQISEKYERKIEVIDSMAHEMKKLRGENTRLKLQKDRHEEIINGLTSENEELEQDNKQLKIKNKKLAKKPSPKKVLKSDSSAIQTQHSFSDLEVIHCLSENVTEMFQPPSNIVTLGHGPFPEHDFDAYLVNLKITPRYDGYPWIVVGRDGWDKGKLIELIEDNDLDEVVVLSQELFVAGIISTHDPFSLPEDILMKFADGHPALEFLMKQGFEWPEIILEELDEPRYVLDPRGSYDRVEESPLCLMGYRVGETRGLPYQKRRNILQKTYSDTIPWVGDDDYMEEWGQPSRTKRLWRMAHHIAREINKRKKIPNMKRAVGDWKEDLDWLKETYYKNGMHFKWPNI
jgi:hypothetical protein